MFQSNTETSLEFQELMKALDFMEEDVAAAAAETVQDAGELIAGEQRRLILGRSKKLPPLIRVTPLSFSKKGNYQVSIGYNTEAIKEQPKSVVFEFGKPGKRSEDGKDSRGRKIGKMDAVPHIRKGADNKKEEAIEQAVEKLREAAEWK